MRFARKKIREHEKRMIVLRMHKPKEVSREDAESTKEERERR